MRGSPCAVLLASDPCRPGWHLRTLARKPEKQNVSEKKRSAPRLCWSGTLPLQKPQMHTSLGRFTKLKFWNLENCILAKLSALKSSCRWTRYHLLHTAPFFYEGHQGEGLYRNKNVDKLFCQRSSSHGHIDTYIWLYSLLYSLTCKYLFCCKYVLSKGPHYEIQCFLSGIAQITPSQPTILTLNDWFQVKRVKVKSLTWVSHPLKSILNLCIS